MTERQHLDPPSPFVVESLAQLGDGRGRRALDLATGRGRHAALIAGAGYRTFVVDRSFAVVDDTVRRLRARGLTLRGWCADLTTTPLPHRVFDLIVVTRYLQRDLSRAIGEALTPGGVLVYETFTEAQRRHGRGPTSPDHLLKAGELRGLFPGLQVLSYAEVDEPDAVARLVACASSRRS